MPAANMRSERLNVRLPPEALATIREAASAQQQDVSAFVLRAAMDHARGVLLRDRVIGLTPREVDQVVVALNEEATVSPELAMAIAAAGRDMKRLSVKEPASH